MRGFMLGTLFGVIIGTICLQVSYYHHKEELKFYSEYTSELEAEKALQRLEIDSLKAELEALEIREIQKLGR